jgi:hypothetical protein
MVNTLQRNLLSPLQEHRQKVPLKYLHLSTILMISYSRKYNHLNGIKTAVFRDVILCSFINIMEKLAASIFRIFFYSEDAGSRFLQNVSNHLPDMT